MVKKFTYRGKEMEELSKMNLEEFSKILTSRERRSLLRGFTESEKKFLERLRKSNKPLKTHSRELVVIPEMVGKTVLVHAGKEWKAVDITMEKLGHRLGEFSMTRVPVKHSSSGLKKEEPKEGPKE